MARDYWFRDFQVMTPSSPPCSLLIGLQATAEVKGRGPTGSRTTQLGPRGRVLPDRLCKDLVRGVFGGFDLQREDTVGVRGTQTKEENPLQTTDLPWAERGRLWTIWWGNR
jgi:hypothetical protein